MIVTSKLVYFTYLQDVSNLQIIGDIIHLHPVPAGQPSKPPFFPPNLLEADSPRGFIVAVPPQLIRSDGLAIATDILPGFLLIQTWKSNGTKPLINKTLAYPNPFGLVPFEWCFPFDDDKSGQIVASDLTNRPDWAPKM